MPRCHGYILKRSFEGCRVPGETRHGGRFRRVTPAALEYVPVLCGCLFTRLVVVRYSIGRLAALFFCTPRQTMAFFTRPQSASAAVKIVAPSAVSGGDSTKTSPKKGTLFCSVP